MDPTRELGKVFLVVGALLVVVGAVLVFSGKLPFRLGHLPGDIAVEGRHGSFYFPIVTCIVFSLALALLLWIVNFLRR